MDSMIMFMTFFFLFWWISSSPSVLLMILLFIVILQGSLTVYLTSSSKLNVMITILTLGGGLFILISFTVMAQPEDQFSIKPMNPVWIPLWSTIIFLMIKLPSSTFLIWTQPEMNGNVESASYPLCSSVSWSMIFYLFILLLSLKIVDSLSIKEGEMFKNS